MSTKKRADRGGQGFGRRKGSEALDLSFQEIDRIKGQKIIPFPGIEPETSPILSQGSDISFSTAATISYVGTLSKILVSGHNKVVGIFLQLLQLKDQINEKAITLSDADLVIEYIELLAEFKSLTAKTISWVSLLSNATEFLLSNTGTILPIETLDVIEGEVIELEQILDVVINSATNSSVLGIELSVDDRHSITAKKVLLGLKKKIEDLRLYKENDGPQFSDSDQTEQILDDGEEEWGEVERNAYERLQEKDVQYIPGEDVLAWISMLEQGCEV